MLTKLRQFPYVSVRIVRGRTHNSIEKIRQAHGAIITMRPSSTHTPSNLQLQYQLNKRHSCCLGLGSGEQCCCPSSACAAADRSCWSSCVPSLLQQQSQTALLILQVVRLSGHSSRCSAGALRQEECSSSGAIWKQNTAPTSTSTSRNYKTGLQNTAHQGTPLGPSSRLIRDNTSAANQVVCTSAVESLPTGDSAAHTVSRCCSNQSKCRTAGTSQGTRVRLS